ncbi:ABC transporter permease [Streptomyces radicis]|uniref:ABC transporter permease n=1 Tax=Streptomyces radicis TaxID=1750517 RepID=A0A3A9WDW0_9ACTN|nr:ABC transporter permease [Streptomyces radicis]RKN05846.1 ABC transporter permease [Streptomyces radicis]RKN17667.1 ABC transporter permease [Streptomyces radicis]
MARLVGRRLLAAVPVLALVTLGMFAVAAASPFDPVRRYIGDGGAGTSQETLDALRRNLSADGTFVEQWWTWLRSAAAGDLGQSLALRQPVGQVIGERVGWSLLLCSVAFVVAVLLGTSLGVLAARRAGGAFDRVVTALSYTLQAAPPFWLALLAIWLFALRLDVLPAGGLTGSGGGSAVDAGSLVRHLTLPAAVLAVSQLPWFVLYTRQGVLDALGEDPVRGARARGLSERTVLIGHALRSGLLPVLTLIGTRVPELITGALLVETVFSWPGIASATVRAATATDFPLLAALTVLSALAVLAGNLIADLLYGLADPRVDHDEM